MKALFEEERESIPPDIFPSAHESKMQTTSPKDTRESVQELLENILVIGIHSFWCLDHCVLL